MSENPFQFDPVFTKTEKVLAFCIMLVGVALFWVASELLEAFLFSILAQL